MSIPSVLLSGVKNESQDLTITTDVLEPNVLNNNQAVFVIPKKGSVLDSKSALKVRVTWDKFVNATTTDVGGKLFSGILGMIKNARLYASGQLISRLDHAGEKIHLDNQFKSQEYKEQYCDVKHLSNSGFMVANDSAQSGLNGAIKSDDMMNTRGVADPLTIQVEDYYRGLGRDANAVTANGGKAGGIGGNNGVEMFLLLEEIFPMLKDIQLPVRFLKDEIRLEIDWEQDKEKWLYTSGTALTAGNGLNDVGTIGISSCVLFLDYITYNPEIDASLEATLNGTGVSIPFRQTAIITKVLPANLAAGTIKEDVLIGQEGRAIMKLYIAKKYPKVLTGKQGNLNQGFNLQGECRSEHLLGQKYNFVVNDLLIYDRDVENPKESYNYFCYTGEKQASCYPDAWEYNDNYDAQSATNDVLYSVNATNNGDQPILSNVSALKGLVKDGIRGQQNWDSVDLSKYGSQLNPQNAMRIGSTPIIYRLSRTTENDVRTGGAVNLTVFVEYLRLFDLRAGELAVRDL